MLRQIILASTLAALLLAGCRMPDPAPANQQQPVTPVQSVAAPEANSANAPPALRKGTPAPPATRARRETQELAEQLNYDEEGGTRAGGYGLAVRVLRDGRPVAKAVVGAVNGKNKLVAREYTDAAGGARLILPEGTYLVVAKRKGSNASRTVTFVRGGQYELTLTP